jgi:hypothetical protein
VGEWLGVAVAAAVGVLVGDAVWVGPGDPPPPLHAATKSMAVSSAARLMTAIGSAATTWNLPARAIVSAVQRVSYSAHDSREVLQRAE